MVRSAKEEAFAAEVSKALRQGRGEEAMLDEVIIESSVGVTAELRNHAEGLLELAHVTLLWCTAG